MKEDRKYRKIGNRAVRDFTDEHIGNIIVVGLASQEWKGITETMWMCEWTCCGAMEDVSHKSLNAGAANTALFKICASCKEKLSAQLKKARAEKKREKRSAKPSPLEMISMGVSDICGAMAKRRASMREINAARMRRAHLISIGETVPEEIDRIARSA